MEVKVIYLQAAHCFESLPINSVKLSGAFATKVIDSVKHEAPHVFCFITRSHLHPHLVANLNERRPRGTEARGTDVFCLVKEFMSSQDYIQAGQP